MNVEFFNAKIKKIRQTAATIAKEKFKSKFKIWKFQSNGIIHVTVYRNCEFYMY